MLLACSRDRIIVILLSAAFLYVVYLQYFALFYYWSGVWPFTPKDRCPQYSTQNAFVRPKVKFDWTAVRTRHPVSQLVELPPWTPVPPPKIQAESVILNSSEKVQQTFRRETIKKTFLRAWQNYRWHAWKADELKPLTMIPNNNFGGWGATLVDSLDTLWIMGLEAEFLEAVEAVAEIDFSPDKMTLEEISIFETIIRYIGGFLSAYELSGCQHRTLLNKAVELGDMLYVGFDTPSRMPIKNWNPHIAASGEEQPYDNVITDTPLADIGTLEVEFTKLSMLTGDMKWYDAAQRFITILEDTQNSTSLPGLWPKNVDVTQLPNVANSGMATQDQYLTSLNGAFAASDTYSIGGEIDSAYEYVPKMALLLGVQSPASERYLRMYKTFVDAAVSHGLFFRPLAPENPDVLLTGALDARPNSDKPTLRPNAEHLACFTGGMLALGSRLISAQNSSDEEKHLELAQRLTDGCAWSYAQTETGIAPEMFTARPCSIDSLSRGECLWNENITVSEGLPKGYSAIVTSQYLLRPEAIESVFYLWRITGQKYWMNVAWRMFESIEAVTATEFGNAEIQDVNAKEGGGQMDHMESFWLAETLKYLYLIYTDFDNVSLDKWVFNTEAHPLRIPR